MTKKSRMRDSVAVISSTAASAKYAWSASPDMLSNGRTTTDGRVDGGGGGASAAGFCVTPSGCHTKTRTVFVTFLRSIGPRSVNCRSVRPSRYWYIHLEIAMQPGGEITCTRTDRFTP